MISTRLRELRKERGLTQQQVANILSISARGYTYYELGKNEPSISTLNKLCDLFECSLDYLVGREDDFGNISIKNPTAELTAEEQNLIKDYRALTPALQRMLQATLQTWLGSDANKKEKPRRA